MFYLDRQIFHFFISITQDVCNYFQIRNFDEWTLNVIATRIGEELDSNHKKGAFNVDACPFIFKMQISYFLMKYYVRWIISNIGLLMNEL
jgi:hypothetical protein